MVIEEQLKQIRILTKFFSNSNLITRWIFKLINGLCLTLTFCSFSSRSAWYFLLFYVSDLALFVLEWSTSSYARAAASLPPFNCSCNAWLPSAPMTFQTWLLFPLSNCQLPSSHKSWTDILLKNSTMDSSIYATLKCSFGVSKWNLQTSISLMHLLITFN